MFICIVISLRGKVEKTGWYRSGIFMQDARDDHDDGHDMERSDYKAPEIS
ncbi:MAG: hypothetical protein WD317_08775 [Balneolaceae bacterium]